MGEWKECFVSDIANVNVDTYSAADDWPFINYLDTGNVTQNFIGTIVQLDTGTDKIPSRARRKAHAGNIIYSTVRPNQRHYAILKEEPENFLVSTGFAVLNVIETCADAQFLYFYLTQDGVVDHLQTVAEQSVSTYPSLNPSDIMNLRVLLPPLPTQRKIAAVLSSLDDKIENNRKICANLEAQAQAIFKSWFVDFEPFGGKMPSGWKMGKLGDMAQYRKERIGSSELTPETFFSTENMIEGKGGCSAATSLPSSGIVPRCEKGDVLVSNIRPYFKKILRVEKTSGHSPDVLCFAPRHKETQYYLYQLLWDDSFFDYVMSSVKGTKMPRGDKDQILEYQCTIPQDRVIQNFNAIVEPMIKIVALKRGESRALVEMRDTLLPKLMSGEIDVEKVKVA